MKSELIRSVFLDELERNNRLIARYEKELFELPKGSIFRRKIGNQIYVYLNYREGQKVISKFLGNAENFDTEELERKIARRKELAVLIKKLKKEKKELEGALK